MDGGLRLAELGIGFGTGVALAAGTCLWLYVRAEQQRSRERGWPLPPADTSTTGGAAAPSTSTGEWATLAAQLRKTLATPPRDWVLASCRVPAVELDSLAGFDVDRDGFARCDLVMAAGTVAAVRSAGEAVPAGAGKTFRVDMGGRVLLPRFADVHTHL